MSKLLELDHNILEYIFNYYKYNYNYSHYCRCNPDCTCSEICDDWVCKKCFND